MGHITNDIQQYSKISWGSNDYTIQLFDDRVQIDSNQGKVVFNAEVMSTEVKTEWIEEATDYTVVIVKMLKNVRDEIYERIDDTKVDLDELNKKVNDYIAETDPRIEKLYARVAEVEGKYAVFVRIVENKFAEVDGKIEALEKLIEEDKGDIAGLIKQVAEMKACCSIVKNKLSYLEKRVSDNEKKTTELSKRVATVESKTSSLESRMSNNEKRVTSVENRTSSLEKQVSSVEQKQKSTDSNIEKLWKDQKRQDEDIKTVKQVQLIQSEKLNDAINKINNHSAKLDNHELRIQKLESESPVPPAPPVPPVPPPSDQPAIWHKHIRKDGTEMLYRSLTDKFTATQEYLPPHYVIVIQEEIKRMKDYMYAVIRDYLSRKMKLWRNVKLNEDTYPSKKYILQEVSICIVLSLAYDELVKKLHKEYKAIFFSKGSLGDRLVEVWKIQALEAVNKFIGCGKGKMSGDDIKHLLIEFAKQKSENDAILEKL